MGHYHNNMKGRTCYHGSSHGARGMAFVYVCRMGFSPIYLQHWGGGIMIVIIMSMTEMMTESDESNTIIPDHKWCWYVIIRVIKWFVKISLLSTRLQSFLLLDKLFIIASSTFQHSIEKREFHDGKNKTKALNWI